MAHPPRALVDDLTPDEIHLERAPAHHLQRVLRLAEGEIVELVDGAGGLARGSWHGRGRVVVSERAPIAEPPSPRVELAVAPPRPARLEWLVGQATELGVASITLLATTHGERDVGSGRLQRLQRVADSALLQCRRLHRLTLHARVPLAELLAGPRPSALWLAEPPAVAGEARSRPRVGDGVLALVGPEGGFDDDERAAARAAGAEPVQVGPHILRVETAALAMAVLARV